MWPEEPLLCASSCNELDFSPRVGSAERVELALHTNSQCSWLGLTWKESLPGPMEALMLQGGEVFSPKATGPEQAALRGWRTACCPIAASTRERAPALGEWILGQKTPVTLDLDTDFVLTGYPQRQDLQRPSGVN